MTLNKLQSPRVQFQITYTCTDIIALVGYSLFSHILNKIQWISKIQHEFTNIAFYSISTTDVLTCFEFYQTQECPYWGRN